MEYDIEKYLDETLAPDTAEADRLWFKESTLSLAQQHGWEWLEASMSRLRLEAELLLESFLPYKTVILLANRCDIDYM
jgi:hypothetical protein